MASHLATGKGVMEAYVAAGFTGKAGASATAVSRRPEVKARVQEIIATQHAKEIRSNERAIERAAINKEEVVNLLWYIAKFGIKGRPLLDDKGNDTGRYAVKPDLRSAGGALRTLAQMGGWLIQKHEIGGPGDFARLTDEELDGELIEAGRALGLPEKELKLITGSTK